MAHHPTGKKFVYLIVTLLLLLSVFANVSADGGHNPFEKEAGGYTVNLVVEEPVKAGSHDIVIKLRTVKGEPVEGATVQVEGVKEDAHAEEENAHAGEENTHANEHQMAGAHESMETTPKEDDHIEEMASETKSDEHNQAQPVTFEGGHEPGEYHGAIDLPEAGNWEIVVHFEVENEETAVHFPVEVQPGFSKAGILAGFLSVNLAAVAAAGLQKRKQAAAKKEGFAKKVDVGESITNNGAGREL